MTRHVAILGIDGSGKSTVVRSLPALMAAEHRLRAASAGEIFQVVDPDQDLAAPGFGAGALPASARAARLLKRLTRWCVSLRWLYPLVKVLHMLLQDRAGRRLARAQRVDVMVHDGNTMLASAGRAANYLRPARLEPGGVAGRGLGAPAFARLFAFLRGQAEAPPPQAGFPLLARAARLGCRLLARAGLDPLWLPDAVVFLDLSPELALRRIAARGQAVDQHENARDLAQARAMYLGALAALRADPRGPAVVVIATQNQSAAQTAGAVLDALRPLLPRADRAAARADDPLGTSDETRAAPSVWRKVMSPRYLLGYLLPSFLDSAWRELSFPLSRLGRAFLAEGYSAGTMRRIYAQDEQRYGLLDRLFLDYPLHRAVYDRLHILVPALQRELWRLARSRGRVRVLSAPCGNAEDLLRALEGLPAALRRGVELTLMDLDPAGDLEGEVLRRASALGVRVRFLRGDLCEADSHLALESFAPFDLALFVGLSSWLPKPEMLAHLRWLRGAVRADATLVSDCFTVAPYAASGRCMGFKASYYDPERYAALLNRAGFAPRGEAASGRDRINHVCLFAPDRGARGNSSLAA